MLLYELKKVLVRPVNRVALLILLAVMLIVAAIAVSGVSYTESDGSSVSGAEAAAKLRQAKEQWSGYVTEDVLKKVIEENDAVNQSPEARSDDVTDNNIAYSRKQGFSDLRELINLAFSGFQSYDYYRADTVSADEAGSIYERRISSLKEWLGSDEIKDRFTDNEKEYLVRQYEKTETPFYYTYADGWSTLLTYSSTIIMVTVLAAGFLVSGIFSSEFALKSDSIYFSSQYGRNRGVRSKIAAGFILQSGIYWIAILLYTAVILITLGAEGGSCMIQSGMDGWKSFYNITYFQEYLLAVLGGYAGSLFILSLAMLVSAKTRSAVFAVTVPFIVLFVPSFLSSVNALSEILGLLPDQLLQISYAIGAFNLYELGGKVTGAIPILFALYLCLYVVMLPGTYRIYRRAELK